MAKKDGVKRLQFDFSDEAIEDLDNLKNLTKSASRVEVIRRALRFYEYTARMVSDGYQVELTKGKTKLVLAPVSVI